MRYLLTVILLLCANSVYAHTAAQRVISLSPHATELAYAAGLGKHLIAVSDGSDYPPQAQHLPKVANYRSINIEKIIALNPDLIITWPEGNPGKALQQLRNFGFHLYATHTHSLQDIANNIEELSQYSEHPEQGKKAAAQFRRSLNKLRRQYSHNPPVRYFYQLSERPIITLGGDNWPGEVFEFCGGKNIFADSAAPYPQVSIEQIIARQPQVMFTSAHAMHDTSMWQTWHDEIPALKYHHIWSLNADWINRPTPRTLKAIKQVCEYFAKAGKKAGN